MKNLIYSAILLYFVMLIMSCTKSDLIDPNKPVIDPPKPKSCDSAKIINYVLTNLTGISTYQIIFSGSQNYIFNFPANGSTTVAVKPGYYSISVFTPVPGNYSQHTFHLNDQDVIKESKGQYADVVLTPCSGPQSFEITPY